MLRGVSFGSLRKTGGGGGGGSVMPKPMYQDYLMFFLYPMQDDFSVPQQVMKVTKKVTLAYEKATKTKGTRHTDHRPQPQNAATGIFPALLFEKIVLQNEDRPSSNYNNIMYYSCRASPNERHNTRFSDFLLQPATRLRSSGQEGVPPCVCLFVVSTRELVYPNSVLACAYAAEETKKEDAADPALNKDKRQTQEDTAQTHYVYRSARKQQDIV
ncbi:unnamed protein product [Plutella xylostella]|uniref:(diamondback moth) hypothetical protein n=1 Tax=Plutella xylostella TaxID=51655 RepID=A0A8S4EBZ3_PLUXY|nr:unnamed protein product [Plutella xylostella]